VNNIVQLANWAFRPPELYLILDLFVGLAVLLKGVGVRAEKNGSGDEVDNMPTTTKPPMLLIEAQLNAQVFKTRVVAPRIVCDKVPNAILEPIFGELFH
jgi:hypothetical protein